MAFAMQSMSLSMPACRPAAAFRARPSTRLGRGILRVQANVTWQLVPEPKFKLSNPEAAKKLQAIDITEQIGEKEAATVGTEKVDEVRVRHWYATVAERNSEAGSGARHCCVKHAFVQAHPSAGSLPLTTHSSAQMLRNVDAGIRVVFECKDEDGSPLAGEASSLALKVRGLRARTPLPGCCVMLKRGSQCSLCEEVAVPGYQVLYEVACVVR